MLKDLAIAIADGASTISDLRVLADQPGLFDQVASVPTARALGAVDKPALAALATDLVAAFVRLPGWVSATG